MGKEWSDGYSADVEIYLVINGDRYDVAQIGDGALILRSSTVIPPGTNARLVMKIDGREEAEDVFLRDGATNMEQLVRFSHI